MKVYIDSEQRRFFRENGVLELEELFSKQAIEAIRPQIEKSDRARNLWRENDEIKRFDSKKILVETAVELFGKRKLVLGFDQVIPASEPFPEAPLDSLFSVQGLIGLAAISLDEGNVIFYSPSAVVDFSTFEQKHLLVGFASFDSCYIACENDPYTHAGKKFGMGFGDLLTKGGHPILCT